MRSGDIGHTGCVSRPPFWNTVAPISTRRGGFTLFHRDRYLGLRLGGVWSRWLAAPCPRRRPRSSCQCPSILHRSTLPSLKRLGEPSGDLLAECLECQPKLFERAGADPLLRGAHCWTVGEDQDSDILARDAARGMPNQKVNKGVVNAKAGEKGELIRL